MLAKNARAFQVKPALDVRSVSCRGVDGLTKNSTKTNEADNDAVFKDSICPS